MNNYVKFATAIIVGSLLGILVAQSCFSQSKCDPIIGWGTSSNNVAQMPLVLDTDPKTAGYRFQPPIEQRGIEYRRFLAASLKINAGNSAGSGTIIFYDAKTGYAYVASCGHLWSQSRSAADLERRPVEAKVTTWYHNDKKLDSPRSYPADVLFWSNKRGFDSSLLRFKPDWAPNYFPIAPKDYSIKTGSKQHSLGCDGAREVAHYNVEVIGMRGEDLTTKYNSPRPGRSGGGLLSNDGYYIATCWGTSSFSGDGLGYFTPLSSIRVVYAQNGYDWLLEISGGWLSRQIPIQDWDYPDRKYEEDYIPIPGTI